MGVVSVAQLVFVSAQRLCRVRVFSIPKLSFRLLMVIPYFARMARMACAYCTCAYLPDGLLVASSCLCSLVSATSFRLNLSDSTHLNSDVLYKLQDSSMRCGAVL